MNEWGIDPDSFPVGSVATPDDLELLAGLRQVAREHLGYEGPLDPDTELVAVLHLDSLRLLTLVVELENMYQVELAEGETAGLVTAADLVTLLRESLQGAQ